MNEKTKPREIDVRRAVMRLKLKPVDKLVLLGVLDRVDWSTMSGQVSSKQIADTLSHNPRSVSRALAHLVELRLITRSSYRIEAARNTASLTTMKIDYIFELSQSILKGDDMTEGDTMTEGDDMTGSVITTEGGLSPRQPDSDDMTEGGLSPRHTINKNNNINIYPIRSVISSPPKRKRLTGEQIKAIETECIRIGDTSHRSRVDVASKLFNIKLIKGGYYV